MTDVETLTKQVEDLMKSKAQKTLEELQKSQPTPPASASNTKDTESRRLWYFPGKDDWRSLEEEERMASRLSRTLLRIWRWQCQHRRRLEETNSISLPLIWRVQPERKSTFPKEDRENPDGILNILLEAFGEKRSLPQLLKLFYERREQNGESLRAYSHSLRELLNRALKVNKKAVVDPDLNLRDQFANSVRDGLLRTELRKFIHEQPSTTFLDIREALRCTEEEKP